MLKALCLLSVSVCSAQERPTEDANQTQPARALAFPEAEGFGATAAGGRGGRVLPVTNLKDTGPGSLRAALEVKGPRIVVFQIAGIIELKSALEIRQPFVTIAGQTAPGDGICLKHFGIRIRDTHDVIIRHLRIRPGAGSQEEVDSLLIYRSQKILIDHCSLSWSVDEVLDISDDWHKPIEGPKTDDVTIQWCILSESLKKSAHSKGEHGYAALISAIRDGDVTVHHNLFAHHVTRIPRPGGRRGTPGLRLEFRNNVIYDWGTSFAGYSADSETASVVQLSYQGNYLIPGPSTPSKGRKIAFFSVPTTRIYAADNSLVGHEEANRKNHLMINGEFRELPQPINSPVGQPEPAATAYEKVLKGAGATLPRRDRVDQRIVRQVRKRTGRLIDSPNDVNGWPSYRPDEKTPQNSSCSAESPKPPASRRFRTRTTSAGTNSLAIRAE